MKLENAVTSVSRGDSIFGYWGRKLKWRVEKWVKPVYNRFK